jgi:acyl carrier protein
MARVSDVKFGAATELVVRLPHARVLLFSSLAGVIGNLGQSSYAAANAGMDALARLHPERVKSIAWGPWAGAGMATSLSAEHFVSGGMRLLDPDLAIEALELVLASEEPCVSVVDADWSAVDASLHSPNLFERLREVRESSSDGGALVVALTRASSVERTRIVHEHVTRQVAAVLGLRVDEIDVDVGLADLGLDSLLAVELRRRLQASSQIKLPATLAFDFPTARLIADRVGEGLTALLPAPPDPELGGLLERLIAAARQDPRIRAALLDLDPAQARAEPAQQQDFDSLSDDALLSAAAALLEEP